MGLSMDSVSVAVGRVDDALASLKKAVDRIDEDDSSIPKHEVNAAQVALTQLCAALTHTQQEEVPQRAVQTIKKWTAELTQDRWSKNPAVISALGVAQSEIFGLLKQSLQLLQSDDPKVIKKTSATDFSRKS